MPMEVAEKEEFERYLGEKRQPDGLHECGTTGEEEKSPFLLFKRPCSQYQIKK